MVEWVAHRGDHVFPEGLIRQFVLTLPLPLRFLFAAQPEPMSRVLGVVQRGISTFLLRHTGLTCSLQSRVGGSPAAPG